MSLGSDGCLSDLGSLEDCSLFSLEDQERIEECGRIMEAKYRDPESKTKLKQIKNDAEKQIQRNKIILKDFVSK